MAIATETRDNTLEIIRALYGKIGDVDSDGTGLVAYVRDLERRVAAIEAAIEQTKSRLWQAAIQVLPWILTVIFAGLFVLAKSGMLPV